MPKLADFGLARLVCGGSSGHSAAQTVSVGKSSTVRGTLAYLPDEYVRNGELSTALDVYSFGVVRHIWADVRQSLGISFL